MLKIKCLNNNQVYKSAGEAGQALHLDRSNITKVCKGKLKAVKGYRFEYINEVNEVNENRVNEVNENEVNENEVNEVKQNEVNEVKQNEVNENEVNQNEVNENRVNQNEVNENRVNEVNVNEVKTKITLTPDHLKKFRNVLTQPTLDLLTYTNMELIESLANDIMNYRERVKNELRKLAGAKNNDNQPQPQQQDETGWDEYERELEANKNNPVMVEKPQEKPQPQPKPKNPYLQDEDDDDWSTSFDDDTEEDVIKWQNEHKEQFTEEELKKFKEEREQKKKEEEEKRRKQEEWDALTEEEKARRKEEERQFFMDWFNNSLDRSKEQQKKIDAEFKTEMAKNKPVIIEEVKQEQEQPKKIYKTINPDSLSEEEKEYRKKAGVPLDIDLSNADDGWDDYEIDDSVIVMR
ncbi:hypothetical protein SAMN02745671_02546 [Anaerovibrio lipolyticus DSM 3074]|uniref:DNA endonuclease I-HmuI-like NUMOD-like domain-containing protein n=1 Tax=Anaerovibrio lipolyticus DSM 3074 TaxID=1120997 RepID=A0A1M6G735_9FIRM|nr:hypothetical protein [Anaerovibrio lipolyticus]SHJ05733.1 hypothetical protein SAMN02745671_02546 [Anaerovibrio lipolyticus DSM 3074]